MKKLYSFLGATLGFIIIILYGIENLSALTNLSFEGMDDILGYFNLVQQYLIYALAGLAGLEFVSGKKLLAIPFILILAFVVISTFFPSVLDTVM